MGQPIPPEMGRTIMGQDTRVLLGNALAMVRQARKIETENSDEWGLAGSINDIERKLHTLTEKMDNGEI